MYFQQDWVQTNKMVKEDTQWVIAVSINGRWKDMRALKRLEYIQTTDQQLSKDPNIRNTQKTIQKQQQTLTTSCPEQNAPS